ncbi:hypothetical protein MTR67_017990 [Solanum verrucosum]|uniref:Retrotransposon gag domain-containing protein n=1 Tax=Solanum verrucosum TaxID=315347 RepID=A0AAF0QLJ4_SOLVR|nr:hypothetical protein MTR67_017990 [Solanum verrucosum]
MGKAAARVRDFTRMNPPKFYGSNIEKDPQEFIDEVYKILDIMEWEILKGAVLDRFFPLEMIEAKVLEFINLRQGNMCVRENSFRFAQLSKYAPSIVADRRTKMSKFVSGVSDLVYKEFRTAMLVHDMDISRSMVHDQTIEEDNLKERYREVKRARVDDGNYAHARFGRWGRPRFCQNFFGQWFHKFFFEAKE